MTLKFNRVHAIIKNSNLKLARFFSNIYSWDSFYLQANYHSERDHFVFFNFSVLLIEKEEKRYKKISKVFVNAEVSHMCSSTEK